ncbi:outer membrane protein assembly factor BamE [Candidatus Pelagibacter bacterium]|nr:outer membrane protein assembly factor BamE [Candidatus Pelagibacter bacterium]
MIKISFILIFCLLIANCSLEKVIKHHGINQLEKKQLNLLINNSNTNDVINLLGPPSTQNVFDNLIWIYIERKTTVGNVTTIGRNKLVKNDVLILEFNNRGLLIKKYFLNKDDLRKLKIAENKTKTLDKKDSFVQSLLENLKRKINDPLGTKKIK